MPLLEVRNITKRFGGVAALHHCNFSIERNNLTALIGPNGAGKTTAFDIITGLIPADSGTVTLHIPGLSAYELTSFPAYQVARFGVARTWQQVRLFNNLSLADHLLLSRRVESSALLTSLIHPKWPDVSEMQRQLLEFGIDHPPTALASELSFGQRKLLQLAMVFFQPHQLVLLDEPVAGVNAVTQQRIEALLRGLKDKAETVVVIEHDMDFIRRTADEVIALDQGRVLAEGKPNEVLKNRAVIDAYLGA